MAMISCPECNGRISDQADACPSCGMPLKRERQTYVSNPKIGKLKIVIGFILVTLGIIYIMNPVTSTFGGILLIIGIAVLVIGKIQHWWHWK